MLPTPAIASSSSHPNPVPAAATPSSGSSVPQDQSARAKVSPRNRRWGRTWRRLAEEQPQGSRAERLIWGSAPQPRALLEEWQCCKGCDVCRDVGGSGSQRESGFLALYCGVFPPARWFIGCNMAAVTWGAGGLVNCPLRGVGFRNHTDGGLL